MIRHRSVQALLVVSLVGCGSTSQPGVGSPLSSSPVASASSSTGLPAIATPAKPAPSPFALALSTNQPIKIEELGALAFAVTDAFGKPQYYRIDDSSVTEETALFAGLPVKPDDSGGEGGPYYFVNSIGGTYPDKLTLSVNFPGERGGTNAQFERKGGRWTALDRHEVYDGSFYVLGTQTPWKGDRFLSVEQGDHGVQLGVFTCKTGYLEGAAAAGAPETNTEGAPIGCSSRMGGFDALETLSDGTIVGVGPACVVKGNGSAPGGVLAVERWPKGAKKSEVVFPPGAAPMALSTWSRLFKRGDELWIYATVLSSAGEPHAYLARFDGKSWTDLSPESRGAHLHLLDVPAKKELYVFADDATYRRGADAWLKIATPPRGKEPDAEWETAAPDGTLWARLGDKLYELESQGDRFEEVPLPSVDDHPLLPVKMVWRAGVEPMLVANNEKNDYFLLLPAKRVPVPIVASTPAPKRAFANVTAVTPACKKPFVVLYGMTKAAPDNYDFPLTRKALKGKTRFAGARFLVIRDGSSRFLVARVPTLAMGTDLVAEITTAIPTAKPQFLCGDPPETIRELKIDLATGDVVP